MSGFAPTHAFAGAYVPRPGSYGPTPVIAYGSLTLPDFPTTRQVDGIDIYPSHPSDDGDNDYIHVDIKAGDKYVFSYCNNGVSPALAKLGYHPIIRSCGTPIGRASGYTMAELKSELNNARNTSFWEATDDLTKTFLTAAAVFIVIGASDTVTGGAAIPANAAEAAAVVKAVDAATPLVAREAHAVEAGAKKLVEAASPTVEAAVKATEKAAAKVVAKVSKKAANPVEKVLARIPAQSSSRFLKARTYREAVKAASGAVATTGATALAGWGTSSLTFVNSRIDDNNSSPSQIHAHGPQFISSISSGCVYITPDAIQTFYHEISSILAAIPGN
jgi:hypothetical protein